MIQHIGQTLAETDGCAVLHNTASLEREIYGRVVSDSVADHIRGCHKDLVVWGY